MEEYILAASGLMLPACGIAIFVILFVTTLMSLKRSQLFGKRTTVVVAMCVSLLCVVGMYRIFFPAEVGKDASGSSGQTGVGLVLLPYTALGIAILVLLLLLFLSKLAHGDERKNFTTDVLKRMESFYPFKYRKDGSALESRPKRQQGDTGLETRSANHGRIQTLPRSDWTRQMWTHVKANDVGDKRNEDK